MKYSNRSSSLHYPHKEGGQTQCEYNNHSFIKNPIWIHLLTIPVMILSQYLNVHTANSPYCQTPVLSCPLLYPEPVSCVPIYPLLMRQAVSTSDYAAVWLDDCSSGVYSDTSTVQHYWCDGCVRNVNV